MGAVFSIFAGLYSWWENLTGTKYSERLGKIHFWLFFFGVNLTFFPMHFLGLSGMPRWILDYPDAFAGWNFLVSFVSLILFLIIIYIALTGFEFSNSSSDGRK